MRKYKHHTICIAAIAMLFSLITINNSDNTSALSYQSNVGVGFTFLPTLNVSLSSNNLTINNLVPGGNAVDSNTITINVSTNIAEGYNLYATVGSDSGSVNNNNNTNTNNLNINNNANTNTNNGYNTANLVNTVDNNYTFTPLSSNISNLNSFTNNNWGYSYSLDSGTTWISGDYDNASNGYNGLPLYNNTGIKLAEEADNTSSTVDFKIAAKASSTQPSGEYTNVINFTVVSNTIPTTMLDAFIASGAQMYKGYFKMQDMTPTICKSIDTDGEKGMQLIDVRDDKLYWVAKLADNNCWMTQNLDLDLSHEVALTSETSDIDPESYGKTIYTAETGYTKNGNIVSWAPSTIDDEGIQRADTIDMVWSSNTAATVPGWTNDNNKPYSANAGNKYLYTDGAGNNTTYVSFEACRTAINDAIGCQHMHIGNYYNWSAAVASNNTNSALGSSTQVNSVCPKNWSLPASGDYGALMQTQGIWSGSGNTYEDGGFNKLSAAPLYYLRAGGTASKLNYFGAIGLYRSSTLDERYYSTQTYFMLFTGNIMAPSGSYKSEFNRGYGLSVRCMVGVQ